jgi:uncharacterized Ntn-hydrolase superfamily protein
VEQRAGERVTKGIWLALLFVAAASASQDAVPPADPWFSTFSIIAFDPSTSELGVGVQSRAFAAGAAVPFAKPGVGAVATQAAANRLYGPKAIALLEQGLSPAEVVKKITDDDPGRDTRQVAVIDTRGRSAVYTGKRVIDRNADPADPVHLGGWAGHVTRANFSVQGNTLASEAVVTAMADAYEHANGTMAERLMDALEAGQSKGGDIRGMQSAGLLVVRPIPPGSDSTVERIVDLRVDDAPNPFVELRRLLNLSLGRAPRSPGAATSSPNLTLDIEDYVAMPITGTLDGKGQTDNMLARMNSMREEPGRATRFFINDLNGPLYILDKATKNLTTYLDFNGRAGHTGLFHKLGSDTGFAGGLTTMQFDPDYARNGRFYTVHIENPALAGSSMPDNANLPALDLRGYQTTAAVPVPGDTQREGVLIEWTDTNTANATFEGTARELLRVQLNTPIHPLADIVFDPTARPGDGEWRVMYLSCGDGGAGESRLAMRSNPQRLDTLVGKILRIIPDLGEHATTSRVSENGRYRVPNDNPFVATAGARPEVWALGLRNAHRLHWAIDPANPRNNRLIANSIGLHTWETVNIIHRGANYGYSQREGNEVLQPNNRTAPLPEVDTVPVQISDTIAGGTAAPTYPVIQYGHVKTGGDAIGDGFLYRGKLIPALQGKYIFTDIATGRIWYADYAEMLAADDGNPKTMATMHEVTVRWKGQSYDSMLPIVEKIYHERGGRNPVLNGHNVMSGNGRADARLAMDASGELFIYTKNDGMIRAITGRVVK